MKRLPIALGAALLMMSGAALAQDNASKMSARQLAVEGLKAYDQGQYYEAAKKLRQAYDVVQVPTVALHLGRALAQLGKLVQASELYLQATRLPVPAANRALQEQAQREAADERAKLMSRIPSLAIVLEGATPEQATVTVDGVVVPPALLGSRAVNPGQHRIEAKRGAEVAVQDAQVAEAEKRTVVLRFAPSTERADQPASAAAAAGAAQTGGPAANSGPPLVGATPPPTSPPTAGQPAPSPPARTLATHSEPASAGHADTRRAVAWVGLGVGGAGLVLSAVTGVMALSKRSSLDASGCTDGHCYDDQDPDVGAYNRARTLAAIGAVVGIAGVAGGLVLMLTAPRSETTTPSSAASVALWFNGTATGLAGRY